VSASTATRHVEQCMGTVFSFDVRTPGFDTAALGEAVRLLHDIDATFSTYRADSEISRLRRGELDVRHARPEVREILRRCAELEIETDGYFSAYAGGELDPSGLVKGWAIERASDVLRAAGSTDHCVNGGGDVQCAGDAAPGVPWRVGIAHPWEPGSVAAVVAGTGLAVATSGTAERGHHVLDPHTGRAPVGAASVTVVGQQLSVVDAYATAAFAMGPGAKQWLDGRAGVWGFGVAADGTTWQTAGFGVHAAV
jgi:FAD:protein FMN transferase